MDAAQVARRTQPHTIGTLPSISWVALPYDHVAVPNPDRQAVWHLRIGLKAFPGLSSWSSGADPGRSPLYDADPEVNCCAIAIGVVVSVVLL